MASLVGTAMKWGRFGLVAAMLLVASNLTGPAANARPAMPFPEKARTGACNTADSNAVTVVIDYQGLGGGTAKYCAIGLSSGATGLDALRAVASVTGTTKNGLSFVCRINSKPGASQALKLSNGKTYTEACVNVPPSVAYWSYWYASAGGAWTYSSTGASSQKVHFGGYEGWSFALNAGFGSAPKPRVSPAKLAAPAGSKTTSEPPTTKPPTTKPPTTKQTVRATGKATSKTSQPPVTSQTDQVPPPSTPSTSSVTPTQTASWDDGQPSAESSASLPGESSGHITGATIAVLASVVVLVVAAWLLGVWRRRFVGVGKA